MTTVWFTGLSGAGKTTVARAVEARLRERRERVQLLDGDLLRQTLCRGLGFSREDRDENIRRIGFVAELLTAQNVITLVAVISPYREARAEVRRRIPRFLEVYVNAPLEVCEARDVKGLYRRARAGELRGFTGIDDPYEAPLAPELVLHTDREPVEESTRRVLEALDRRRALVPCEIGA